MRAWTTWIATSIVTAVAAFAGCSSSKDAGNNNSSSSEVNEGDKGFDVNDVSYLFPIRGNEPTPSVDVPSVWPQSVFDGVIAAAPQFGISFPNGGGRISDWRIFSFRYDPCAPSTDAANDGSPVNRTMGALGLPTGCIQQIRLIAQPIGRNGIEDVTAHLVFAVGQGSPDASDPIIAALLRLKASPNNVKTSGQPLQVHPGLADPSKGRAFGAEVSQTLSTILQRARLVNVAFMGLEGGSFEPWVFFAGRVENGQFSVVRMPTFPTPTNSIKLNFRFGDNVIPRPLQPTSTADLFLNGAQDATPSQRTTLFTIDHPETTHFFNMDCVSCHTATSREIDLNVRTAANDGRKAPPPGITGYVRRDNLPQRGPHTWNVRNFGYFGDLASISLRTAAETAAVADFINKILKRKNPGKVLPDSCEGAVWQCFINGQARCLDLCGGPGGGDDDDVIIDPPPPPAGSAQVISAPQIGQFGLAQALPVQRFRSAGISISFPPGQNCDRDLNGAILVNDVSMSCDNCGDPNVATNGPWEIGFAPLLIDVQSIRANVRPGSRCKYTIGSTFAAGSGRRLVTPALVGVASSVHINFKPGCGGPFTGTLTVNGTPGFTCDNCGQPGVAENGPFIYGLGSQIAVRTIEGDVGNGSCQYTAHLLAN